MFLQFSNSPAKSPRTTFTAPPHSTPPQSLKFQISTLAVAPANLKFQISNLTFFSPAPVPSQCEIPNLKSEIPPPCRCNPPLPSLSHSVFARAPMILPGMPSGRPCALAKTPARTRKHCSFSSSPPRTRESDNVDFPYGLFSPSHSPPPTIVFLFTQHLFTPPLNSALPRPPLFFHSFLALPLPPPPSSPRLITSPEPSRLARTLASRLLTGIISPYHSQYSDASSGPNFRAHFSLVISCLTQQNRCASFASSRDCHLATRKLRTICLSRVVQQARPFNAHAPPSPLSRPSLPIFR